MADEICIRGLKVEARVGVPDEERAQAQVLALDIGLVIVGGFRGLDDQVENTVDYDALSRQVRAWCMAGEWRLIESLVEDLASRLLGAFPLIAGVEIEVKKFVLPDCEHVAVRIERRRAE